MSVLDIDKNIEDVSTPEFESNVKVLNKLRPYLHLPFHKSEFLKNHTGVDCVGNIIETGCVVLWCYSFNLDCRLVPGVVDSIEGERIGIFSINDNQQIDRKFVSRSSIIRIK